MESSNQMEPVKDGDLGCRTPLKLMDYTSLSSHSQNKSMKIVTLTIITLLRTLRTLKIENSTRQSAKRFQRMRMKRQRDVTLNTLKKNSRRFLIPDSTRQNRSGKKIWCTISSISRFWNINGRRRSLKDRQILLIYWIILRRKMRFRYWLHRRRK